jgi:uncharacterized protein YegJ (DUF2314 family)
MSPIVVGVPGPWADHGEVIKAVATVNTPPRFLAMGTLLMQLESKASFELEVYPRDPALGKTFAIASGGRLSEAELAPIAEHRSTVYLIGGEGSLAEARRMMAAATHLLDAGGAGVKIESAGLAHSAEAWRHCAGSGSALSLYRAYVTLVGGTAADHHYSCGMHNLGLPDVSVVGSLPLDEAADILTSFNHWNLIEHPALQDGAWFACAAGEPAFTASHRDFGYEADDPLNNPLGRWHLEPTEQPPPEPFAATGGPLFMAIKEGDPEIVEAVARARASIPFLLTHFRSRYEYGRYLVKLRLTDGDEEAFFWALLDEVDGKTAKARLFELPHEFKSYQAGQTISCPLADLQDWAIIQSGTLVGGFSLRVQRGHIPEDKRRSYDLFSGTISYAPLGEITGASV